MHAVSIIDSIVHVRPIIDSRVQSPWLRAQLQNGEEVISFIVEWKRFPLKLLGKGCFGEKKKLFLNSFKLLNKSSHSRKPASKRVKSVIERVWIF